MSLRVIASTLVVAACALVLVGCAGLDAPASADAGRPRVVASTSVYGDIATEIGGDLIDVSSLITSIAQDPHSYEASARDQLAVSRADLLIENGGGYDAFMDALISAAGTNAPVVSAVEFAEGTGVEARPGTGAGATTGAGRNEHVWYDPGTISRVAGEIARRLTESDPANATTYSQNLSDFATGIGDLEARLDALALAHAGEKVFVTEPMPLALVSAAGLVDATPPMFSQAVESGRDVSPSVLLEAARVLGGGGVRALIVNAQTGGAETDEMVQRARDTGIPVLQFTELVPDGDTYLTWMRANVAALSAAVSS